MKIFFGVSLFSLLSTAICSAAGYSTNFNTGYNTASDVAGQNGWTITDSTADLSFFVSYNTTDAAALGGYYNAPIDTVVRLAHDVSLPLVQSSFNVDFAVVPSTVDYPDQDTFGWSFRDSMGTNLLSIEFEPDANDPNLLNISWFTGIGGPQGTGWAILYNGPYSLDVDFSGGGGSNAAFTATIGGSTSLTFSGVLPGFASSTLMSVGADFAQQGAAAGDNYMIIDNFMVVPEPSTGAMIIGLLAISLGRRNRKHC